MKGSSMNTHMGNIDIDNEVIAQYAGSVAVEVLWYRRYGRSQHEGWSGKALKMTASPEGSSVPRQQ